MKRKTCPYLGLESGSQEALPQPSHLHRCLAAQRPELVGIVQQAGVCLTPDYGRCPRLSSEGFAAAGADKVLPAPRPQEGQNPENKQRGKVGSPKKRRRPSIFEVIILVQFLAITLAMAFVLFSVGYRSWVTYAGGSDWIAGATWGLIAEEVQIEGVGPARASLSPTAQQLASGTLPLKTLVPTFTPIGVIPTRAATSTPKPTRPAPTRTPRPTLLPPTPTRTPQPTLPPLTPTWTPAPTRLPRTPTWTPAPTRLPPTPTIPPTPERLQANSPPTRLVIPGIKLDTPVETVGYKMVKSSGKTKAIWDTPEDTVGFHDTSSYPGQGGNIVMNGHRDIQGAVFWRLTRVEVGDRSSCTWATRSLPTASPR